MTDQRPDPAELHLLDLSTIESTSSLSLEQRIEWATRILDEAVSPTFTPRSSPNTLTQSSLLKIAVEWALAVADKATSPQPKLTSSMTESCNWPNPSDIMMERTTSSSLWRNGMNRSDGAPIDWHRPYRAAKQLEWSHHSCKCLTHLWHVQSYFLWSKGPSGTFSIFIFRYSEKCNIVDTSTHF